MANYNKVLLMGNLTRDPELRYAGGGTGGTAICKFGLATNRQWRNAQSGEMQEETCFVDIVVFGRQAETCNEYLSKGRPVFLEGRLSFSTWEDRESGAKRSKLEVVAERVQFLGGRGDSGGGEGGGFERRGGYESRQGESRQGERQGADRQSDRSTVTEQPASAPRAAQAPASNGYDFDDIPF